jgi:predicted GNAT family acetyltransferase
MSEDGVSHDAGQRRFTLEREGHVAYLAYRMLDEATVELSSTFTPPPLRGRGLAAHLARHALQWADERGLKVVPACWFVAQFVEREPQWKRLLA